MTTVRWVARNLHILPSPGLMMIQVERKEPIPMSDETKDRARGVADEAKGRVKSAAGDLSGDDKLKGEGMLDQLKGKVGQGMADAKEKAGEVVDRLKQDEKK
jgi:uncharacterized protein YjbJ (UPF0337 family)